LKDGAAQSLDVQQMSLQRLIKGVVLNIQWLA
jgi:hypothetical protein